ncbi:MAG: RsmE family RNA methyltransferase [Oscillochloridaceae bacterium umkhey_bin13]
MKNTLRFFVDPAVLHNDEVRINDQGLAHQLGRVLRLTPGARIWLLDGLGTACEVELQALGRDEVRGLVQERGPAGGELPFALSVYLALIRPERFEWALQKCVELGVSQVVPVAFERSLPADRAEPRRLERWQRIGREAAEQAGRGRLPQIMAPLPFAAACEQAAKATLPVILWEGTAPPLRKQLHHFGTTLPASCAVMSGPEGGITPAELTFASERGIMPASLGPRILRAETAPVIAAGALCYQFETGA